jgi:hypothetical protein
MRRRTQGCAGRAVNGAGERRQGRAACGAESVSRASSSLGARSPQEKYTTRGALSICADACLARHTRAGAAATGARRASGPSSATTAPPTPAPTLSTRRARPSPQQRAPGKGSGGGARAIPAGVRARAGENLTPARPVRKGVGGGQRPTSSALSRQTAPGAWGRRVRGARAPRKSGGRAIPRRLARRDGRLLTSVWREADRSGVWAMAAHRQNFSH